MVGVLIDGTADALVLEVPDKSTLQVRRLLD